MFEFDRIVLIVLDGTGCGALPDAANFGDTGANTLGNMAQAVGMLELPMLQKMGLGNILHVSGVPSCVNSLASWGRMAERSAAKDSTTGHWEMAGVVMDEPFQVYAEGFPPEIIRSFGSIAGAPPLGNVAASGTEIIQQLGAEHVRSGRPIVYTSTDSVFQVAAHEDVVPVEHLYDICRRMRGVLDVYRVGRVIARPFVGNVRDGFVRTSRRRDFSMPPPQATTLDILQQNRVEVHAVGKIHDIFCGRGIDTHIPTASNAQGMEATSELFGNITQGLVFTNLIDFDMIYGHRRDAEGFAAGLRKFDSWLASFVPQLGRNDLLIISADHGCDPTLPGSDHTREYVPLLVYTPRVRKGVDLGERTSFADIGASVLQNFGLHGNIGTSFLDQLCTWPSMPEE